MKINGMVKAVLACLAAMGVHANAALSSSDWRTAGDDLLTVDDVSGLQWLDLAETYGLTYDYVS